MQDVGSRGQQTVVPCVPEAITENDDSRIQLARVLTNIDDENEMSRRHEPTVSRMTRQNGKTLLHRGLTTNVFAGRDTRTLRVWCLRAAAPVCHEQGREDSSGSADRSIKNAELAERCPLITRRLIKRMQRRLQESEVADVRHVTAESGLISHVASTAEQGQGVRTQWPGSPWKQGFTDVSGAPRSRFASASHRTVQA